LARPTSEERKKKVISALYICTWKEVPEGCGEMKNKATQPRKRSKEGIKTEECALEDFLMHD